MTFITARCVFPKNHVATVAKCDLSSTHYQSKKKKYKCIICDTKSHTRDPTIWVRIHIKDRSFMYLYYIYSYVQKAEFRPLLDVFFARAHSTLVRSSLWTVSASSITERRVRCVVASVCVCFVGLSCCGAMSRQSLTSGVGTCDGSFSARDLRTIKKINKICII